MEYVNCKLTISDPETVAYEVDYAMPIWGNLLPDELTRLTVKRLNNWVETQEWLTQYEDLQLLGLHLYKLLFGDEKIRQAFQRTYTKFAERYREEEEIRRPAKPDLRLRLRLVFTKEAQELAQYPWEFLYLPIPDVEHGFFFTGARTELILTRFVPELDIFKNLKPSQRPLKIMLVYCQPDDMDTIEEEEVEIVVKAIRDLKTVGHVEVVEERDPTFDELGKAIARQQPHILHFIGHGEEGRIALIKAQNDPAYDLKKRGKQVDWIPSKELKAWFVDHKPRLIFLNACKGAAPDSLKSFTNTARELVFAEVPAVVAMQYDIANQDAAAFARSFYEKIGEGKEIDEAVKYGRLQLGTVRPAWGHRRFGTPVVYLQTSQAIVSPAELEDNQDGPQQIKCRYYDECKRMIYPDQIYCNCPLNMRLRQEATQPDIEAAREVARTSTLEASATTAPRASTAESASSTTTTGSFESLTRS